MLMLALNETIDQMAMTNRVHWHCCVMTSADGHVLMREDGHVLRREDGHVLRREDGHVLRREDGHVLRREDGHVLRREDGHVLRRDDGHVLRWAVDFVVGGKRKKGRPKSTWKKRVEEESEKVGLRRGDVLCR